MELFDAVVFISEHVCTMRDYIFALLLYTDVETNPAVCLMSSYGQTQVL